MDSYKSGKEFQIKFYNDGGGAYLYSIDDSETTHSLLRANAWTEDEFLHLLRSVISLPYQENEIKEMRQVSATSDLVHFFEDVNQLFHNTWSRQYVIKTFVKT
ncbi:MAG: hypothetical protein Q8922_02895 [Bacteroidota bacterium]|nr:hypothetical protein [Bacteroidota bacterium]MDP4232913.1 hypothetical protein [Bacteroidota bacterium]MDP4241957.1 hypothetical protein [Bacteroidota bacterium]MDP4286860.1 hypothetical protein [Bacteroidota bacterium]